MDWWRILAEEAEVREGERLCGLGDRQYDWFNFSSNGGESGSPVAQIGSGKL